VGADDDLLSLVTPTGGRAEAFAFLADDMRAQTYAGPVQWVIVDDCDPPTIVDPRAFRARFAPWVVEIVRPSPRWTPGRGPTLTRNLIEGLTAARGTHVLPIEDDDVYLPDYLSNMRTLLSRADLCGQVPARYYNVAERLYREMERGAHASLCQTGFHRRLAERVTELCRGSMPSIDIALWRTGGQLSPGGDVVSIKGMPGRPGIGVGHRPPPGSGTFDPELRQLAQWIGPARTRRYAPFFRPGRSGPGPTDTSASPERR
jgi:hypothetical protein